MLGRQLIERIEYGLRPESFIDDQEVRFFGIRAEHPLRRRGMSASESQVFCLVEQKLKPVNSKGLRLADGHDLLIRNWMQIHMLPMLLIGRITLHLSVERVTLLSRRTREELSVVLRVR